MTGVLEMKVHCTVTAVQTSAQTAPSRARRAAITRQDTMFIHVSGLVVHAFKTARLVV